jgi:adenylylsulfate kinase-like enzyme
VKAPEPIKGDGVVNGTVKGGTAVDNGDGTVTFTYTGIQGGKMGTHSKVIKKEKFTAHAEPAPASEATKSRPKPKKAAKPKAPKPKPTEPAGPKFKHVDTEGLISDGTLKVRGTHDAQEAEIVPHRHFNIFAHKVGNGYKVSHVETGMDITKNTYTTKAEAIDKASQKMKMIGPNLKKHLTAAEKIIGKLNDMPGDTSAPAPTPATTSEAPKAPAKAKKPAKPKAPKAPAQPKAEATPEFVTAKHSGTADNKPKFNVGKNAEALPEIEGIQSFVHEIPGNQWIVSEKSTGIMISGSPMSDKQNAIDYAKAKIAKMPDYLKQKIQDTKDEHGDIEANKDKIMPELGSGAGDGSGKMTPAQQKFAEHAKKKFEAAIMDKEDIATGINHALGYLSQDEKDALKQYHMDGNASLMTGDTWSHLAPTLSNIKQIKAEQAKIEAEKKKAEIEAAQKDAAEKQKKADKELYEKIEPHKIDESKEKDDHYELYHGTSVHVLSNIINNGFKLHGLSSDFGHCAYFKSPEFDPKESHSGNGTKAITGFFAKSNPVYIKAYIHKSHVLDLSKGEPSELKQMKSEFSGNMHGTGQKKLALKYLAGVDTTSLSYGEIDDQYNKLHASMPPHQLGAFTPYEAYCKKNGLKGIVGVLPDYKSEGWQFGVYDTSALKIHDWGKAITQTGPDSVALIKAIDTGKKAVPPYALMKVSMDGDHYVLHVAALDDVSDMEKSLFTVRSMMTW